MKLNMSGINPLNWAPDHIRIPNMGLKSFFSSASPTALLSGLNHAVSPIRDLGITKNINKVGQDVQTALKKQGKEFKKTYQNFTSKEWRQNQISSLRENWRSAAFNGVFVPLAIGAVLRLTVGSFVAANIGGFLALAVTTLAISVTVSAINNMRQGKKWDENFFMKDEDGSYERSLSNFNFAYLGTLLAGSALGGLIAFNAQADFSPSGELPEVAPPVDQAPPEPETPAPVAEEPEQPAEPVAPIEEEQPEEPVEDEVVDVQVSPAQQARMIIEGLGLTDNERLMETLRFAEAGQAWALNDLGSFFANGCDDLPIERGLAYEFFEQAAEMGNAQGQFNQAFSLMWGRGVEIDQARAVEMMGELAESGRHSYAQSYYEQWSTNVYTGDDLTGNPCATGDDSCQPDTGCDVDAAPPLPEPIVVDEPAPTTPVVPAPETTDPDADICPDTGRICWDQGQNCFEPANPTSNYAGVCYEQSNYYENGDSRITCTYNENSTLGDNSRLRVNGDEIRVEGGEISTERFINGILVPTNFGQRPSPF